MKNILKTTIFAMMAVSSLAFADQPLVTEIPIIKHDSWERVPDVAQYGRADWSNVVGMIPATSVYEAKQYAEKNPEITYFFHVKGYQMALENPEAEPVIWRVFQHGDTVFFTGEPWWGTAPGLADGYMKSPS